MQYVQKVLGKLLSNTFYFPHYQELVKRSVS